MGILGKRNALEVLFTPVQRRLIGILFGRPRTRFQSADLIRQTGAGVGAVHRVLTAFAEAGLLKTSRQGNQKFYQADDAHPMYPELCAIVAKTLGLAGPIEQVLSRYQRYISVAFISGVLGKKIEDASAVIEVFVISEDVDVSAISRAFKAVASRLGRNISPLVVAPDEWRRGFNTPGTFVGRAARQAKSFLIGTEDDLRVLQSSPARSLQ